MHCIPVAVPAAAAVTSTLNLDHYDNNGRDGLGVILMGPGQLCLSSWINFIREFTQVKSIWGVSCLLACISRLKSNCLILWQIC